MRPLRLELEGFTSFRDRTVVSFEDTDLFVLTGATGSGKSSLIDAMVFALYGSVPRYDNRNLVAPVISQGKVQARVRLDFEAGGHEYTAVRVVRRTPSGGASTREAVLERKVNGGDPITLARTSDDLTARVENDVIGLGLDHFTKCAVLPQGEFATFMRSTASERQKLLERLLGLGLYDRLQKEANRRSAARTHEAAALESRLEGDLADATAEAVRAAVKRVSGLEKLGVRISEAESVLNSLAEAAREVARAAAESDRQRELLRGVAVPADAQTLSRRHRDAAEARARAEDRLAAAAERHQSAREARAKLPESALLRGIVEKRRELADRNVEAGQAWRDVAVAEETLSDLAGATPRAVTEAEARVAALEGLADQIRNAEPGLAALADAEREAGQRAAEAERRHSRLAGVTTPGGAESLAERHRTATTAAHSTASALETATRRREEARAARSKLPERASLERIRDEWGELADLEEFVRHLGPEVADKQAELASAVAREEAAAREVEAANATREALRREHGAADLARHLEEGEPCPVCLQEVAELPRRDPAPGLEAAEDAVAAAERTHRVAREQRRERERRRDEAAVTLRGREEEEATLHERLRAGPGLAEVVAGIAEIEAVEGKLRSAEAGVEAARGEREVADSELSALQSRLRPAWDAYREVRDAVAAMKPPPAHGDDLAASWTELAAWAAARAGELQGEAAAALAGAEARRAERERQHVELRDLCRAHGVALDDGDDPGTRCAEAQGGAREAVRRVKARLAERERAEAALDQARGRADERTAALRKLEETLAGAPGPEEVTKLLDKIGGAQRDIAAAETDECATRAERAAAVDDVAAQESRLGAAWQRYRAERDRLAELKPPAARENDLAGSWKELAGWCATRAAAFADAATAAATERAARETEQRRVGSQLREHCRARGLDLAEGDDPATRCAESLGSAREALGHLRAAAEERERVAGAAKEARRRAAVAKDLGRHLSATGFRRWLQNQVLGWLVAGAAVKLRELSSGQYSLDLDHRNEFQVIDHRNADEPRPARTLSGGETFLASLALALSLAERVAGLAAQGSPRLEALFLDEGFGALDPETLEVVAASIDRLGTERMVGLVTHVAELAARIPVQYRVKKVGNSSSVERVET